MSASISSSFVPKSNLGDRKIDLHFKQSTLFHEQLPALCFNIRININHPIFIPWIIYISHCLRSHCTEFLWFTRVAYDAQDYSVSLELFFVCSAVADFEKSGGMLG